MFKKNDYYVIAVDHGYGNVKTANTCTRTGVVLHEKEPTFRNNLLIYNGKMYTIGEGHKEFMADKVKDDDYYIMTLAAAAKELRRESIYSARVVIAAGLPLSWVTEQKKAFAEYLMKNKEADFTFKDENYHIEFAGVEIFAQGFAAIADRIGEFTETNMLCDIGNGTMNIMFINERRPVSSKCFTEKFGTYQCILAAREKVLKTFGVVIDEAVIERVLRTGTAGIDEEYLNCIRLAAYEYVDRIYRILREHEYDPKLMKLHVVGGGSCLIRNFGRYDSERVFIHSDICATAKGYEYLYMYKHRGD